MTMITSILAILATASSSVIESLREVSIDHGIKLERIQTPNQITFSDENKINLDLHEYIPATFPETEQAFQRMAKSGGPNSAIRSKVQGLGFSHSGYPIGKRWYVRWNEKSAAGYAITTTNNRVFALSARSKQIIYPQQDGTAGSTVATSEPSRFAAYESLFRWYIALAVQEKTTQVDADTRRAGSTRYQRLDTWAKAKKVTLNSNRTEARFSLQTAKGLLVVPLASGKVKLGEKWIEVPDVVFADLNGPYLPESLLAAL